MDKIIFQNGCDVVDSPMGLMVEIDGTVVAVVVGVVGGTGVVAL